MFHMKNKYSVYLRDMYTCLYIFVFICIHVYVCLFYDTFPREMWKKCLLSSDRETIIDQTNKNTNFVSQWVLLALFTGILIGKGLFKEQGWFKDSCISKNHKCDSSQQLWITAQHESNWKYWGVYFPGWSICLSVLQAAQLMSASSRDLSLSESYSQQFRLPIYTWV